MSVPPPPYQPPPYHPPAPPNKFNGKHKTVLGCGGFVFMIVLVGSIGAACSPQVSVKTRAVPGPTVTETVTATVTGTPRRAPKETAPKETSPRETASAAERAKLSNYAGQQLQAAQDAAQAEGFFILTSHDATGAGRMQLLDRNWKVCSQKPGPGKADPSTTIDFATVKLEETCP